jgi:glutaredoxin
MKYIHSVLPLTVIAISLSAGLTISQTAHATLYKWVGPNGEITYSDKAPPQNISKVETRNVDANASTTTEALPFELDNASKNNPVTLYASNSCVPCDDGRTFLKENGIPFSEKSISSNDDIKKLKEIDGNIQLPLLIIGSTKLHGFNAGDWRASLNYAAYPKSNILPHDYHYAAPEPAAPVVNIPTQKRTEPHITTKPAAVPSRDPNGIQF